MYLSLAEAGLRMPVGTDLVLHEKGRRESLLLDGEALGKVVAEAAGRYHTPLAFPLMDLTVEKQAIAIMVGISEAQAATYHFTPATIGPASHCVDAAIASVVTPRMKANASAISWVSKQNGLVPIGMSIGPFSMMTKLIADPIAPLYMAGAGVSAVDDPEVALVEACIDMALKIIRRSIEVQVNAGAKAVFVCEPAASTAFISPKQFAKGSDLFERFVMQPNRVVKQLLDQAGVDLIFHNCGELVDPMVSEFATLDPVIFSLGSSRKLWHDAALVPNNIVLYGNLPTKKFYSDAEIPLSAVPAMTRDLMQHMNVTGHPFILGSECDVLCVDGSEALIKNKVEAFLTCEC